MTKTRAMRPSVTDRELLDAATEFAGRTWYTYLDGSYSCTAVKPSDGRTARRPGRR
jgi:hypothetical protein